MPPAGEYRADQVGSLLRPPELLQARAEHEAGRLAPDALRAAEDQAILAALAMQRQAGLDVVTDGEYRRRSFMGVMADATEGFVPIQDRGLDWQGPGGAGPAGFTQRVGGRLRQVRRLTAHESAFLKTHAGGPFKIAVPSANQFRSVADEPGQTDPHYPTRGDLLRALTDIVRAEVRALAEEGVPYIQIDAPNYTQYVDARWRERTRAAGLDPDQELDQAIAADNACLEAGRREGVTLAVHLCRGNSRSRWLRQGGYDPIAERLFNALQVDRFLLEYDTERAGGFDPLRFVPPGRTVVLGLVTTKEGALEPPDLLLRRIDEAARYVPLEHLALSPQCGFASSAPGNLLSMDDQRRKLELVAETARKVWG
jgi:5-methyltetrahydropteroyltriglutamate--homocysteine methyltransferase